MNRSIDRQLQEAPLEGARLAEITVMLEKEEGEEESVQEYDPQQLLLSQKGTRSRVTLRRKEGKVDMMQEGIADIFRNSPL